LKPQIAQRAAGDVQIDRSVWKAHENMPLKNVYLLFANLRCIRLFIISGDRLTGIISRSILFKVPTVFCLVFFYVVCFFGKESCAAGETILHNVGNDERGISLFSCSCARHEASQNVSSTAAV